MKRLFTVILVLILLSFHVYAESSIEGYIYSTDILTFVNGKPIAGYNIGGRTVVIAEDLIGYGFTVRYNDELRMLKIISDFNTGALEPEPIERGKVGRILGNVYQTDIITYYNGIVIPGYNIGGKTAICLEDLGDTTDSPNANYGYSKYLGKSVWNAEERTISYTSFLENAQSIAGIPGVSLGFSNNVISVTKEADSAFVQEEFVGWYRAGTGMARYNIHPLYFNYHGEQLEVGSAVCHPTHTGGLALMYIKNPKEVKEMVQASLLP